MGFPVLSARTRLPQPGQWWSQAARSQNLVQGSLGQMSLSPKPPACRGPGSGVAPWHNVPPPRARRRAAVRLRRAALQPAHLHGQGVLRQQEEGGGDHHPAQGLLLPEHPGELPHARDGAVRHEVLRLQHVQRRAGDLPARYGGTVPFEEPGGRGAELPAWLEMWLGLQMIPVLTQHLEGHPFPGGTGPARCPQVSLLGLCLQSCHPWG